ncbi:MAG: hypothetical protein ACFCU3_06700 [Verrucomicrobiales bacterium]
MMSLIRKIIYVVVFIASAISFVVIFQHGFTNFPQNLENEVNNVIGLFKGGQ